VIAHCLRLGSVTAAFMQVHKPPPQCSGRTASEKNWEKNGYNLKTLEKTGEKI